MFAPAHSGFMPGNVPASKVGDALASIAFTLSSQAKAAFVRYEGARAFADRKAVTFRDKATHVLMAVTRSDAFTGVGGNDACPMTRSTSFALRSCPIAKSAVARPAGRNVVQRVVFGQEN